MATLKNVAKIKSATGYDVLYSQTSADMVVSEDPLPAIGTAAGTTQEAVNAAIEAKFASGVDFRLNAGNLEYFNGTEWSSVAASPIKSIQRGVSSPNRTITISAVNVDKSVVVLPQFAFADGSGNSTFQNVNVVLTNSTTLTLSNFTTPGGSAQNIVWQVVEYN